MKYPKRKKSEKKKLRDKIGALDFKILKIKRGAICEIHRKKCPQLGRLHILNVGKYPRMEFAEINIAITGWFCSHFYLHHNSDDPRAIEAKRRILELRGYKIDDLAKAWDDLLLELKAIDKTMPRHNMTYLQLLYHAKQKELEVL